MEALKPIGAFVFFFGLVAYAGENWFRLIDQDVSYRALCTDDTRDVRAAFIADCVKCGGEDECAAVVRACEKTAAGIYCKQARHRCAAKSENGASCAHWVPDEGGHDAGSR